MYHTDMYFNTSALQAFYGRIAHRNTEIPIIKPPAAPAQDLFQKTAPLFFCRIAEAESPTLITAYEKQIKSLEEETLRMDENIAKCGRPLDSFDGSFRTASNPYKTGLLNPFFMGKSEMVGAEGFEPPTKTL